MWRGVDFIANNWFLVKYLLNIQRIITSLSCLNYVFHVIKQSRRGFQSIAG